jgi:hypothetical protein
MSNADAKTASALCPLGKKALGGGYLITTDSGSVTAAQITVYQSNPTGATSDREWFVSAAEQPGLASSEKWSVTAYVICATVT